MIVNNMNRTVSILNIDEIIRKQDSMFMSNKTRDVEFRRNKLKELLTAINDNEDGILKALKLDLNKCKEEAFMSEMMLVLDELKFMIKNIGKLSKPKLIKFNLKNMMFKSRVNKEPFGKVLIFTTWNYPFQLAMVPLIGAIACGNTAIVKLSEFSIHTNKVIKKILNDVFDEDYVCCINEEVDYDYFLSKKYDYIFFTGSEKVGRIIGGKAGANLIPCTLELGSRNPCIIEKTANLDVAAKRVAWGKFLNAGQTCVAPNHLFVDGSIYDEFLSKLQEQIKSMYSENPHESEYYPKIISEKHFERLALFINNRKVIGGRKNKETLQIEPTIVLNIETDDDILKEEIFGPILPIIKFSNISEVIETIKRGEKPLAFYVFTNDKQIEDICTNTIQFGGCCVNDTIMHITNIELPFGGIGSSGHGVYHSKYSFSTFTKEKAVLKSSSKMDLSIKYPPFDKDGKTFKKIKMVTKF